MSTQTRTTAAADATLAAAAGSLSLRGREPLQPTGALNHLNQFDVTPVIGREFPDTQLVDLLTAPNSDDLIRELAVTVSERGVAFFRAQDITVEQQKELGRRLGTLSGNPKASGLHVHPVTPAASELGDEVTVISSDSNQAYKDVPERRTLARNWHSGRRLPCCGKLGLGIETNLNDLVSNRHHLRVSPVRLCDSQDPHPPRDGWRHPVGVRLRGVSASLLHP